MRLRADSLAALRYRLMSVQRITPVTFIISESLKEGRPDYFHQYHHQAQQLTM